MNAKINILWRILILLISTQSFAQVKTSYDYDKIVDFGQLKTFKFTEDAINYDIQELNRKRILDAIRDQLISKGMSESQDADILVNFYFNAHQEQRQTANTNYYGAGGRYNYRWGAGFSSTTIDVESYIAGTIFIDLIDDESNSLIWQGRGTGTLQENISPEKREKRINKAIAKIFKKYPPVLK
jgi:hypothetical protein